MVFRYYSVFKVHLHLSGDYSEKVTPVPIPNTVVKFLCADDTIWVTVWKSRSLPVYGPVVKRLRHRPFTAVTRVRFPVGSPPIKYALVAELADAPDLGSGGRPWGFESLQAHHLRLALL